jgi:hypothetical protein
MKNITTQQITDQLNATGYNYFGDRPRAVGNLIMFGCSHVRLEGGVLSNNKPGKARAITIGWAAVEACKKAVSEIVAHRESEEAAKAVAPQHAIKVAKAASASEIGDCPRSVDAMLSYVPAAVISKVNSAELADLIDAMWSACQSAKAIAIKENEGLI